MTMTRLPQDRPGLDASPQTSPDAPPGRVGSAWTLVARREVVVKLTDRSFLIGTVFTLLLITGFMGYSAWDAARTTTYTVAATADARTMADRLAEKAPGIDDG